MTTLEKISGSATTLFSLIFKKPLLRTTLTMVEKLGVHKACGSGF